MDRDRVDTWCERIILGLVLAVLGFAPLATGAVRPIDFLVVQALTILLALVWAVRLWVNPGLKLLWPPVCWIVLLFTAYVGWRYQVAPLEYVAREDFTRVVVYAVVFLAVVNNLHRSEHIHVIVGLLLAVATLIALYAGYQFVTGSDHVWGFVRPVQYAKRGSGTFISPNHMAGFLELVLPLGLAYLMMGRIGHVPRILVGYASFACLLGIGVSVSRGAWIACAVSLALFLLILLRRRDYWIPAALLLAVLAGIWAGFVNRTELTRTRFAEIIASGSVENIRFLLWKPAIQVWQQEPWFGGGPGHFDERFRVFRPEKVQMRPYRAHNDYLNTLADLGVVGLALVILALVAVLWGAVRAWKFSQRASDLGSRRSSRSAFLLGGVTALTALLVHSVVDFNMHIPANALAVIVVLALLSAHWRFATERFWHSPGLPVRIILSLLLVVAAGYLVQVGQRRARETRALNVADRAEEQAARLARQLPELRDKPEAATALRQQIVTAQRQHVEALHLALRIEPRNFTTVYRIGEALRTESWQGKAGFREKAKEAMDWFDRAAAMNPFDPYPPLRRGMCLDWIGRTPEAAPAYARARELDPNNYYVVAHLGWHAIYLDDYDTARELFVRSLKLKHHNHPDDNPIAAKYLAIVDRRLEERAIRAREQGSVQK